MLLSLAGGLTSTVFVPLTAIAAHLDWRTTYLVLAALFAVTTIPATGSASPHPWRVMGLTVA